MVGDLTLSMHLVDCIHCGIRYASTNAMTASQAIESFKIYYGTHSLGFSSTLRDRIAMSVATIVKEFPRNMEVEAVQAELQRMFSLPPIPS
jgi:hypothetical protein